MPAAGAEDCTLPVKSWRSVSRTTTSEPGCVVGLNDIALRGVGGRDSRLASSATFGTPGPETLTIAIGSRISPRTRSGTFIRAGARAIEKNNITIRPSKRIGNIRYFYTDSRHSVVVQPGPTFSREQPPVGFQISRILLL